MTKSAALINEYSVKAIGRKRISSARPLRYVQLQHGFARPPKLQRGLTIRREEKWDACSTRATMGPCCLSRQTSIGRVGWSLGGGPAASCSPHDCLVARELPTWSLPLVARHFKVSIAISSLLAEAAAFEQLSACAKQFRQQENPLCFSSCLLNKTRSCTQPCTNSSCDVV